MLEEKEAHELLKRKHRATLKRANMLMQHNAISMSAVIIPDHLSLKPDPDFAQVPLRMFKGTFVKVHLRDPGQAKGDHAWLMVDGFNDAARELECVIDNDIMAATTFVAGQRINVSIDEIEEILLP